MEKLAKIENMKGNTPTQYELHRVINGLINVVNVVIERSNQ